ncbi:MAG: DinB family protein [Chitinophagaceae bacterium]|nr:DinB family protein [Chitinophagaceae bacterium]
MLIDHIIITIGFTRKHFLELTADCSAEEMNAVPKGFKNNLVWNLGHVVSSQQTLCYALSEVQPRVEPFFIETYKPTTAPGEFVAQEEILRIRELAEATIPQLSADYHAGMFKTYSGRQTRYGVLLSNIDEAIAYISTHETLHFGYAKAMLKLLRS